MIKNMSSNIAIIGAGPSGLFSALELAKRGLELEIFEEHSEVGLPLHCAGLISINGFKKLGIDISGKSASKFIQNKVKGAIFFSPNGLNFRVCSKNYQAVVIDRYRFDKHLADIIEKRGYFIKYNYRVIAARYVTEDKEVLLNIYDKRNKKHLNKKYPLVIDAEGWSGTVRKKFGISEKVDVLPAYQVEVKKFSVEEEFVELHFDRRFADGFFAWVIPLKENIARIGLATRSGSPKKNLLALLKTPKMKDRYKKLHICKEYGGSVVISGAISRTFDNGLIIVGDAAGHVKPTTGGGVILGGIGARIAGKIAADAYLNNDFSKSRLSLYEKLWKKYFGRELSFMKLLRNWLNKLSNRQYSALFKEIKKAKLDEIISEEGDMDFQLLTFLRIIKRYDYVPRVFKFLFRNLTLI
ncbi:MAG: NAD(P)/FAD-dependent oxidoreductase [Candidatus Odinarchaeota archaeon]|nr:NAD(P)/FAD-dependent oxidoreductase [Candidatus Odinarchaeota archaeon]